MRVADAGDEVVREFGPAGGHEVRGDHGPQRDHVRVAAGVANHADGLHRQEDGERLGHAVVEARAAKLLDVDGVGFAEHLDVFRADFAEHPHAQARTGERMAMDQAFRQAEFEADGAHLVLEEVAQGFDQFEMHPLRKAADVVVRLDDVRLAETRGGGLDHVRVDGALGQPPDARNRGRSPFEDADEGLADGLAVSPRVPRCPPRRP